MIASVKMFKGTAEGLVLMQEREGEIVKNILRNREKFQAYQIEEEKVEANINLHWMKAEIFFLFDNN